MEAQGGERFRIIGELGVGAVGKVQLAFDAVRGIEVALKRTLQLGPEALFRLKQEFRAARDLSHVNLVRLYDLVVEGPDTLFTMEPIRGVDITRFSATECGDAPRTEPAATATICRLLTQLVVGVEALHARSIVHRDIKPSNVLVETWSSRVVLLDFGFALPLPSKVMQSGDREFAGTLPYMAPECLWGAAPIAASDWYSVGALAAELFLGRPLFGGPLQEMVRQKDRPLATLKGWLPELPAALDDVICRLVARDVARRPGARELLETLRPFAGETTVSGAPGAARPAFIGRARELEILRRAISEQPEGAIVRVRGPSGIGKTALVETALEALPPDTLVLRGECHPREQVRFGGLDEVMDQLSRHLRNMSPAQRAAVLPPRAAAMSTLFPVLSRVPGLEAEAWQGPADPRERRDEAVAALRDLWRALAARQPIVVWIDDVQRADRDGMQLLRELAWRERPAIAWWFFSYRSGPGTDAVDPFDQWGTPHLPTKVLDVAGLPDVEAEELARRLGTPATAVGTVVRESGGYPFFVSELARYLQSQPGPVSPPSVAAVVEARVSALPAEARHLLEYLSLATDPLPPDLLRALLPVPSAGEAVAALERAGLVRFGSDRERGLAYEPQHDRIREAVSASIPGQVLRERHAALGRVLETASATASKLAFHYRAAGDVDNGLRFTLDAARESAGALAFDEAAALLRTAIALHPPPVPWRLHRDLAEALVNAGQCSAGGAAYHAAAQAASAQGEGQDTVRRLSRCAGEQYLYGGQIEDGRGLLREALRAQGIRTPRWPLISSAVLRMRFLMRRSAATPPAVAAVPEARREMVDALWNTAKGTVMVEHVLGDCYALQALFAALQVGDPSRLIPPLGHEAVSQANIGGEFLRKRSFQILEETARLVALVPTPYNRGWLSLCRGAVAFFEGRWRDASAELTAASETFRVSCVGAVYEYAVASTFLLSALLYEGRFRELETLQPALQRWARERGNIYAEAMFASGNTSYLYLAQDAPARAIEEADRVLAAWGATRFTSQHYYHFVATVSARLYQGEGWEAWRRVVATWPQLRRAHFLTLDCIGVQLRDLRARAALAAAAAGPPPADLRAWTRRRLLDAAQGESRRIRRSQLPHARPTAAVVRACVHAARGGVAQARQAFSEAAHGFDSAAMPHLREAVRLRAAELSPEGAATLDDSGAQAAAALREMGVARPERLAAVMVPLEQRPRPALNPGLRESAAAPPPPP